MIEKRRKPKPAFLADGLLPPPEREGADWAGPEEILPAAGGASRPAERSENGKTKASRATPRAVGRKADTPLAPPVRPGEAGQESQTGPLRRKEAASSRPVPSRDGAGSPPPALEAWIRRATADRPAEKDYCFLVDAELLDAFERLRLRWRLTNKAALARLATAAVARAAEIAAFAAATHFINPEGVRRQKLFQLSEATVRTLDDLQERLVVANRSKLVRLLVLYFACQEGVVDPRRVYRK